MRRQLLTYLPPVILLCVGGLLPPTGRDFVGSMNGREFALFVAFWWTILAVGFRLVWRVVRGARGSTQPRGFDVIPENSGNSTSE